MNHTLIILVTIIGGYLLLYGIEFTWKLLFQAPSALDERRKSEILLVKDSALKEVLTRDEQISSLRSILAAKHPHDDHKEEVARELFARLSPQEKETIKFLLDAGEASRGMLQSHGLNADPIVAKSELSPLLAYRSIRPGNRTVETDRSYYINPEMKDALRNVLYPPPRVEL